jgi:hypothetical protein
MYIRLEIVVSPRAWASPLNFSTTLATRCDAWLIGQSVLRKRTAGTNSSLLFQSGGACIMHHRPICSAC